MTVKQQEQYDTAECAEREKLWKEYCQSLADLATSVEVVFRSSQESEFPLKLARLKENRELWVTARCAWLAHMSEHRCAPHFDRSEVGVSILTPETSPD